MNISSGKPENLPNRGFTNQIDEKAKKFPNQSTYMRAMLSISYFTIPPLYKTLERIIQIEY